MRTDHTCLLAGLLLLPALHTTCAAQHADSVNLSMRTLAQAQRWHEEKVLRDKLDALYGLKDGAQKRSEPQGPMPVPRTVANPQAAALAPPSPTAPVQAAPKPGPVRPGITLLSVFGEASSLSAETVDHHGEIKRLEANGRLGNWRVLSVLVEGVLLAREHSDQQIFLAVGESMQDGNRP